MKQQNSQVQELINLHYEFRQLIEAGNWVKVNMRMREIRFSHDINKAKTVLILTQGLVNHSAILEERYLLYQWHNEDMGFVWSQWPLFKDKDHNVPDKYKNQ